MNATVKSYLVNVGKRVISGGKFKSLDEAITRVETAVKEVVPTNYRLPVRNAVRKLASKF